MMSWCYINIIKNKVWLYITLLEWINLSESRTKSFEIWPVDVGLEQRFGDIVWLLYIIMLNGDKVTLEIQLLSTSCLDDWYYTDLMRRQEEQLIDLFPVDHEHTSPWEELYVDALIDCRIDAGLQNMSGKAWYRLESK